MKVHYDVGSRTAHLLDSRHGGGGSSSSRRVSNPHSFWWTAPTHIVPAQTAAVRAGDFFLILIPCYHYTNSEQPIMVLFQVIHPIEQAQVTAVGDLCAHFIILYKGLSEMAPTGHGAGCVSLFGYIYHPANTVKCQLTEKFVHWTA